MQLKQGHPIGCIGCDMYSDTTMANFNKGRLMSLLHVAQHNYESLLDEYDRVVKLNHTMYQEAIEMKHGLQKLANMNYEDCKECPQLDTAACLKEQIDKLEFKCLKVK